jgi:hypothetical protein
MRISLEEEDDTESAMGYTAMHFEVHFEQHEIMTRQKQNEIRVMAYSAAQAWEKAHDAHWDGPMQ